ncbi:hypothetical protein [Massilia sp. ZL223]|uniref:hypothetical protein n=1 Tax=Massilia sp. ZL223 TaxID=2824904 RepID=UPI001B840662|nr:hypothetical protein [Massilia sp. ZL223]MBQ5964726.1 hypothetical protein [Massilia sp. ZL223]
MPSLYAVVVSGALAVSLPALGAGAQAEHETRIPEPSQVARAVVILVPLDIQTRYPLRESHLLKHTGCTFQSNWDGEKIAALVNLLKDNVTVTPEGVGYITLRNLVYLHLVDGSRVKFMFGRRETAKDEVPGGMDNGNSGSYVPLLANTALLDGLRDWALPLAPRTIFPLACLSKSGDRPRPKPWE